MNIIFAASGLEKAMLEYNDTYYGARIGLAKKVAVVITDGFSQNSPANAAKALRDSGNI